MKDLFEDLNEVQKQAVSTTEGPLMIIAGAGSGKTRVLTYRIAHLIDKGIDSFNILALTFTNKAAREMKERISSLIGGTEAKNLWMGTFHSVFARILRAEAQKLGFPSNFTIYDTQDSVNVIKKVIAEMQLDTDIYKPKQVLGRISTYKNNLITVRSYFNNPELIEADASAMRPKTGEIYRAYVERCFKSGAMDFDDLLLRTNELLTRFPEILAKYQDRFRYIMVDEYQDTNHSQYLIVKALASRFENICVVGDDAQSIYAFRGANIKNILNFKKDYPDAKVIPLEQNYRSTQIIVEAANTVISQNKEQLDKNVWTSNPPGDKIPVYRALSDADEANYVAAEIFNLKVSQQKKNKNFAVLYRTNAQSRAIEEALRKKNIGYKVYGGLSFYQRKEIKDLLAYLRILVNPKDQEALLRIINYPTRGIGDTTVNKLIVGADKLGKSLDELLENLELYFPSLGLNKAAFDKLTNFWTMIQSFQVLLKTEDVYEVAMKVAVTSGILRSLKEDDTPEGISRVENIQELMNSLQGFVEEQKQLDEGDPSLNHFLENIALASDLDSGEEEDDKVSLMTIHLAKGLEFPVVFLVGLEENLFPSQMSMNTRQELEEERRLFYVALTRAEEKAYFTYAITRFRWGKIVDGEPSRFMEEVGEKYMEVLNVNFVNSFKNNTGLDSDIFDDDFTPRNRKSLKPADSSSRGISNSPKKLKPISNATIANPIEGSISALNVGNQVLHDRFGRGEVISIEGDPDNAKAVIKFENEGEKKLLLKFAKLKVL
ncbi:ATP-dependent helicase [Apibacter adventoris]|uniref:ATP-dependent helicase n=1 Tax=Apibacter adventoris TaxID=1679466 RepID=UPI000CF5F7C3|nr:UvrD-helicase domain-containing protein [Apibacter adventoris]PQL94496.1 ATP-dependent DNA helicase [Apibacter adventoris]